MQKIYEKQQMFERQIYNQVYNKISTWSHKSSILYHNETPI